MDFEGVRRRGGKDGIRLFEEGDVPDPYENKEKPLFTTKSPSRCFGLLSFKGIAILFVLVLIISGVGLYLNKEQATKKYTQIFSKTPEVQTTAKIQENEPTIIHEQKQEEKPKIEDSGVKVTQVEIKKPKKKKPISKREEIKRMKEKTEKRKRYDDDEEEDDEEEEERKERRKRKRN